MKDELSKQESLDSMEEPSRENSPQSPEEAGENQNLADLKLEEPLVPNLEESPESASTPSRQEELEAAGKAPSLALDFVEGGDEDHHFGKHDKVSKQLPDGIHSKMLYKDVVRIAWPSVVELSLTQLASMVDLMMVGRLGAWAITSVGLATQPRFLAMTMFMAMNVGATAMVARYKGAGRPDKANEILRQAIVMTIALSIVASIAGFLFSEPLIAFMGAEDAVTLAGGTAYLQVQMAGLTFVALSSTITATLRGVGNSRTAMIYNLTANAVNVLFNFLLIEGRFGFPRLEVFGASLATVIGQAVACFIAVVYVMGGKQYLRLRFTDSFKPNLEAIKSIINIGIPAMIEQFVMRAGMIIYSKTVASLGTVAFATHNVCMNIQSLTFMNGQAMAVSATSLVGQSLGKKRPDMAQAYASRTQKVGMAISIVLAVVFIVFGRQIVMLYTDDPVIIETGAFILRFVAFIQPFQASQFILAGALRGAGDTRATAIISFLTVLIVRPGLAIFFINVFNWGLEGAWIALAVDQLLRSFLVLLRYNSGKWKTIVAH